MDGESGLLALCLTEFLGGGGGEIDGDRTRLLRSLPGDLRDDLEAEKTGDGVVRILGGDGVTGARFLYGERDLLLVRGDLLRDLYNLKTKKN